MASTITEKIKQNELRKFINGRDVLAEDFNLNFEIIREAINDHDKAVMTIEKFKGLLTTEPAPSASEEHDWYINISQNIMRIFEGKVKDANGITTTEGSWRDIGAKQTLQVFDTVTAFEAGTQENELALLKVKVDPLDPASKEELFVAVKHKKADGTFEVIQYATKEYIDRQIKGTGTSLEDVINEAQVNLEGLQREIEFMNDGGKTSLLNPSNPLVLKEKQDKLRDDQFIETAPVDFLDISAISSAAGISADLNGVKKDVNDLKAKDINLEGTLNGLQNKVDNLATNTVITNIEKKADANTAAIAALATNPTISGISSKANANDAAIKALQTKEQGDVNKLTKDLTNAQTAIDTKIGGKADKSVTDALTGRVTKNENDITDLKSKSSTQASTVTQHTTKIGALETTVGNQAGTLQTHGTTLTGHTQGIAKNVEDIKDLKNLASFMGIYVPSSFPHTTTASEIKTHFGAAKLGMFSFVKTTADGDHYEIWTAEAITVGGVPQATGDWVHEAGADITINMKPYLAMKMKTDLSGQEPPTAKGQVIYGNTLDPQDNKWTNLTEVLKDAYEAKLIAANKGKLMTIVNTGTDAAPVWDIAFEEPALQGTDLLMEATGGWSSGYTPQIGDVVVVNEIDADGKITKLGATVAKAMFGESEEKTPGSGVWTAKTDSKDKMVVGGDNTTKLVYIDNPDFTALGTDTRPRIWTFKNGDTKGGWQPLDEAEINGKANFVGTDTGKILIVKAVDATTGNVELEPIALTEADIQKIKDDATALDARVGQNESDILALENLKTDVDTLKDTTVPAIDTRVTDLETFQGYFNDATDGGYVFKTNDTNYLTKDVKTMAAELVTDTNFGTTDAEKEAKLMTSKEIADAIDGSLEPRQKELINFQQQKTKPDGTPEYEADGVTPVMIDLADDKKPVKFTGEKDTALTQASSLATNAAQGVVVTTGSDLTVSQMVGKDADAADGTPGPANDDKKLVSKKYVDEKDKDIAITNKSTLTGEALWNALEADKFYIIKTKTSTTENAISNEKVIIEVHSKDDTAGLKFTAIALDNTFHSTGELTFSKPAAGNTTDLPEVVAAKVVAAGDATETIIKNVGKVSDYMKDIAKAEAENKLVRFWHEIPGPKKWTTAYVASDEVYSVATSSDGKYMVVGARDGKIYVSNNHGVTWTNPKPIGGIIRSVSVSSDGKYMIAGSDDHSAYVSNDFGVTWTIGITTAQTVSSVAISSDGQYMIAGSVDYSIYVSNNFGVTWTVAKTTGNSVQSVATSSDGKYMVVGANDGKIYVSNNHGATWTTPQATGARVQSVSVSSNGQYMVAGSRDHKIYVSNDFGVTWTVKAESGPVTTVSTSSNGQYMIAGGDNGNIYVSNNYGVTWTVGHRAGTEPSSLSVSSDGQYMIAGSYDNKIYVSNDFGVTWIVAKATGGIVRSASVSSDGKYIIAGSFDKNIYVSSSSTSKHHHALVTEVDKDENKVFTTEQGIVVEIGNLQLDGKYHLEIEVTKGTTIADGTSTGGNTKPTWAGLPTTKAFKVRTDTGATQVTDTGIPISTPVVVLEGFHTLDSSSSNFTEQWIEDPTGTEIYRRAISAYNLTQKLYIVVRKGTTNWEVAYLKGDNNNADWSNGYGYVRLMYN